MKTKLHSIIKKYDKIAREQKMITKMMDNLYMDKLKGSITDSDYDKYYLQFREEITEIGNRQSRLQEAEAKLLYHCKIRNET